VQQTSLRFQYSFVVADLLKSLNVAKIAFFEKFPDQQWCKQGALSKNSRRSTIAPDPICCEWKIFHSRFYDIQQ